LIYADDVNLQEDDIDEIKKNTETSVDAIKEVGLEVTAEETICCCLFTRMQGKFMT
jgi:hypothetical protein